jgi:hypothetical protein
VQLLVAFIRKVAAQDRGVSADVSVSVLPPCGCSCNGVTSGVTSGLVQDPGDSFTCMYVAAGNSTEHGQMYTPAELDSAQLEEELGGKTAREILEQQTIDANGGVDQLLNLRNPIGEARWSLMPQPYSR